jgi:hypothetical protein
MTESRPVCIMVVANKRWEAEPLIHAFVEPRSRPTSVMPTVRLYDPEISPVSYGKEPTPRLTAKCQLSQAAANVQIWCLEDWMDPGAGSSNTPEKVRVLSKFMTSAIVQFGIQPDVVVAFGTAGIIAKAPLDGCVTVGTRVFIHDPFGNDPIEKRVIHRVDGKTESMWSDARLDRVLDSGMPSDFFRVVSDSSRYAAEARFVNPPIHSASPVTVLAGNGFASVGTVNVTNYDDYIWADQSTVDAFRKSVRLHEVGSVETTHGLIRLAAEDTIELQPHFLYISGITDTLGSFDMDVAPRVYAQNLAAAHNAGIVATWLIPEITNQVHPLLVKNSTPKSDS